MATSSNIQGAPIKNDPLGNILCIHNRSRFPHEIDWFYRGFRP